MNSFYKKILQTGLLCSLVFAGFGCGSSSNNDQGVSFSLNGFFADLPGTIGLIGYSAAFGSSVSPAFAEFQNNLAGQGIRVSRINLSYEIPGASVNLPSTSVGITALLGPTPCVSVDPRLCPAPTTLPPAFNTRNVGRAQFSVVPAVINEYLVLNRDSLPPLPFTMEVSITAVGTTTSGDSLTTNEGVLSIEYSSDNTAVPSDPAAAAETFEG